MGFGVVGSSPSYIHHNNKPFQTFSPRVELETYSTRYPQENKPPWFWQVRPYIYIYISGRPAISPFQEGRAFDKFG